MTKSLLVFFLLCGYASSSQFVLDVAPIPFEANRSPVDENADLDIHLEVKSPNLDTPLTPGTCTSNDSPVGDSGNLTFIKKGGPWKVRFSTHEESHLFSEVPFARMTLQLVFGDRACDKKLFQIREPKFIKPQNYHNMTYSFVEYSSCYLYLKFKLKSDADCQIVLDQDDHSIEFELDELKVEPGKYQFDPCRSFMKLEVGQTNPIRFRKNDEASGYNHSRFLEDETCIYCRPGKECACCPNSEPDQITSGAMAVAGVVLRSIALLGFTAFIWN